METSLPTPMTARVYVNLPEGNLFYLDGQFIKAFLYWAPSKAKLFTGDLNPTSELSIRNVGFWCFMFFLVFLMKWCSWFLMDFDDVWWIFDDFLWIFMDINGCKWKWMLNVFHCSRSQSSRIPGVRLAECGKVWVGGRSQVGKWGHQLRHSYPLPSGKHTKIYGKSQFLMGKPTINVFYPLGIRIFQAFKNDVWWAWTRFNQLKCVV